MNTITRKLKAVLLKLLSFEITWKLDADDLRLEKQLDKKKLVHAVLRRLIFIKPSGGKMRKYEVVLLVILVVFTVMIVISSC